MTRSSKQSLVNLLPDHLQRLEAAIGRSSGTQACPNNFVKLLIDGPQTYASMFAAIRTATHHVHLETYIFGDGEIGLHFAELLQAKARDGVAVRLICDTFGSRDANDEFFERLRSAGIKAIQFRNYDIAEGGSAEKIVRRNHRKLLIVDGRVFFTGGINISSEYRHASGRRPTLETDPVQDGWRDTHIKVQGPAVHAAQNSFVEHWNGAGEQHRTTFGNDYFPDLDAAGEDTVRVLAVEGDERDGSAIRTAYLAALEAAKASAYFTHGYFVPDDEIVDAMKLAVARGVDVRLILPGVLDSKLVLYASRGLYHGLLESGVRIFETQDIVLHAKTAVIDNAWTTIGSSNLDFISLYTNDEINVTVLGERLASEMQQLFRQDVSRGREIKFAEWKARPIWRKFAESLALRMRPFV